MATEKNNDFRLVGWLYGAYRLVFIFISSVIGYWLANNFEPLRKTVGELVINIASISHNLSSLNTITDKLEENQSSIVLLVNSNKEIIKHNRESIEMIREDVAKDKSDINDLKIRVYYLEKK